MAALAISYHQNILSFYLNGELKGQYSISEAAEKTLTSAFTDGQPKYVNIGPLLPSDPSAPAVLQLDEFDLLNTALDEKTLRRLSFTNRLTSPEPSTDLLALGKQLFFDTRLSANGQLSCGTCHRPENGFSTDTVTAPGIYQRSGKHNVPSLIGINDQHAKMLDASAPSFETQWLLPLADANEMGATMNLLEARFELDNDLRETITQLTGEFSLQEGVSKALAAYMRSLTKNVNINEINLSASGVKGKQLFYGKARCSHCHNGPFCGWKPTQPRHLDGDGRADITGLDLDKGAFKTPSLWAIKETAPYFHNGSADTLEAVINLYNIGFFADDNKSQHIRPLNLTDTEISHLVAFLGDISSVTSVTESSNEVNNQVKSYGLGCDQQQCIWIIMGTALSNDPIVEVRNAQTGSVISTINPTHKIKQDSSVLTLALTGEALSQFRGPGILFNTKYTNNAGQIVRSPVNFIAANDKWPGPEAQPTITSAGSGCQEGDCIWIVANGVDDYTIIELVDAETNTVLEHYATSQNKQWGFNSTILNLNDNVGTFTFRVDRDYWPQFAGNGLIVRLINRPNDNSSRKVSNAYTVVSPNLYWQTAE